MAPALGLWVLLGCAPLATRATLATEVIASPGATGEGFGDPALATNGVRGGGESMG